MIYHTPDEVAALLGLEDSEALYRWLEYSQPQITEQNHIEDEMKDFLRKFKIIKNKVKKAIARVKDEK